MIKENYKITATDKSGNILEEKTTGKMYDAFIKASFIYDSMKEKYPNAKIERVEI